MNESETPQQSRKLSPQTTRLIGRVLFIMGAAVIFAACKNLEPAEAVLLAVAAAWLVLGTWMSTIARILLQREDNSSKQSQ